MEDHGPPPKRIAASAHSGHERAEHTSNSSQPTVAKKVIAYTQAPLDLWITKSADSEQSIITMSPPFAGMLSSILPTKRKTFEEETTDTINAGSMQIANPIASNSQTPGNPAEETWGKISTEIRDQIFKYVEVNQPNYFKLQAGPPPSLVVALRSIGKAHKDVVDYYRSRPGNSKLVVTPREFSKAGTKYPHQIGYLEALVVEQSAVKQNRNDFRRFTGPHGVVGNFGRNFGRFDQIKSVHLCQFANQQRSHPADVIRYMTEWAFWLRALKSLEYVKVVIPFVTSSVFHKKSLNDLFNQILQAVEKKTGGKVQEVFLNGQTKFEYARDDGRFLGYAPTWESFETLEELSQHEQNSLEAQQDYGFDAGALSRAIYAIPRTFEITAPRGKPMNFDQDIGRKFTVNLLQHLYRDASNREFNSWEAQMVQQDKDDNDSRLRREIVREEKREEAQQEYDYEHKREMDRREEVRSEWEIDQEEKRDRHYDRQARLARREEKERQVELKEAQKAGAYTQSGADTQNNSDVHHPDEIVRFNTLDYPSDDKHNRSDAKTDDHVLNAKVISDKSGNEGNTEVDAALSEEDSEESGISDTESDPDNPYDTDAEWESDWSEEWGTEAPESDTDSNREQGDSDNGSEHSAGREDPSYR